MADIEAKLAELTTAGATLKEPASDVGDGRLVATVADPDGNVLGIMQVPVTPLPSSLASLPLRRLQPPRSVPVVGSAAPTTEPPHERTYR